MGLIMGVRMPACILLVVVVVVHVHSSMEHDFIFSLQELPNVNQKEAAWFAQASNTSITKKILGDSFDAANVQCGIQGEDGTGVRPFKILMSSSAKYVGVLVNWLLYYHRVCPNRMSFFLICLDHKTEKAMREIGMRCHNTIKPGRTNHVWLWRTKIATALMLRGYDVFMCDADAVWLRNPWPYLQEQVITNKADIVSSRASFPEDVGRRMGATLCLGFIYIRSSPVTVALWRYLADSMSKSTRPDDQRSVNQILMESWMKYTKRPRYVGHDDTDYGVVQLSMKYSGHLGDMPDTLGKPDRKYIRVALLGHESFRRVCEGQKVVRIKQSVVLHCFSEKAGAAKEDLMVKLGAWLLQDDWFNATTAIDEASASSVDAFLLRVLDRQKLMRDLSFQRVFLEGGVHEYDKGNNDENSDQRQILLSLNITADTAFITPGRGAVGPDLRPHRPQPAPGDYLATADGNTEGYWQGRERTHLDGKPKWKGMKQTKKLYSRGKGGPASMSKRQAKKRVGKAKKTVVR
jgi:hypothetical protein